MPRFSQQVLGALANPQYGMLTGQALANVGGRLSQIPENIREEQQRKALQAATQMGVQGYASGDPAMMAQAAQAAAPYDPKTALAFAEAGSDARILQQKTARTEALRTNLKARAANIAGLSGLDIDNASEDQLEAMRVRVANAEQKNQINVDTQNRAIAAAEAASINDETIDLFQSDPEGLLELSREVLTKQQLNKIDNLEKEKQIKAQAKRATEAGMPESFIKDVTDGFYEGRNSDFADMLSGKALSQKDFLVIGGDNVPVRYPTLGGKVLINNKFVYPNEANLVGAPSVTAETAAPKFSKGDSKMAPFAANAAGIASSLVDNLDDVADFNSKLAVVAGETIFPFKTDFARKIAAFQGVIPDVLARIQSGAAIKDDEMARYQKMFSPSLGEITSPIRAAEKIVRAAALVSVSSKIASGEVSFQEGRQLVDEAGRITFSEEEENILRGGKKGSLKQVVKKYTDQFLEGGGSTTKGRVDSILEKHNL